jgi:hypothetical protein
MSDIDPTDWQRHALYHRTKKYTIIELVLLVILSTNNVWYLFDHCIDCPILGLLVIYGTFLGLLFIYCTFIGLLFIYCTFLGLLFIYCTFLGLLFIYCTFLGLALCCSIIDWTLTYQTFPTKSQRYSDN